jgi:hypothetical protein
VVQSPFGSPYALVRLLSPPAVHRSLVASFCLLAAICSSLQTETRRSE